MTKKLTTTEKKNKKFSSRLVVRVFITSLLCLIIPLMIYCVNIMRVYYNLRINDSFQAVSNVTSEKIHLFQQVLDFQFASMDSIALGIQGGVYDHKDLHKVLKDYADEKFVNAVFYIKADKQSGRFLLENSSDPNVPKIYYDSFVNRYDLTEKEKGLFIGLNSEGNKVLFLNLAIRDPKTKEITGFLIFDIHFHMLVKSIFDLSEWQNLNVSLIGEDDDILASTSIQYEGLIVMIKAGSSIDTASTLLLTPHKHFKNAYHFSLDKMQFLAAVKQIPLTKLKLMSFVPKRVLNEPMVRILRTLFIGLVVVLAIGGGVLIFFLRKLSKPMEEIHKVMHAVSEGDLSVKYVPRSMGFEVNSIGEMFNTTVMKLSEIMEEVKTVKVNEEVLATELSLGQKVQHSLLPAHLDQSQSLETASRFRSAAQVGGDCYDFLPLREQGRDLFYVGDTAGKGIMACLYSLSLRSLLRAYGENIKELDQMVIEANDMFYRDTEPHGIFVTAWIGAYEEKTGTLRYTSMGHPPAILKRASGGIELLTTDGIALGAMQVERVEIKEVQLNSGDMLIMYTDGIIEAQDSHGQYYGIERLKGCISSTYTKDANEMANAIYDNVLEFYRGQEQFDDITLFITKVK